MFLLLVGILNDPIAPSSFGAWVSYVSTNHVGIMSFLIVDFFLFFGVAVLTVVQASQVNLLDPFLDAPMNLEMLIFSL